MDLLRRLLQACRTHYEKLVLILTLVGLGVAVWVLWMVSQAENEKQQEFLKGVERRGGRPIAAANLARPQAALQRAQTPPALDFATPHNLFNPVKWQRRPDGSVLKIQTGKEVGPDAMVVGEIKPLKFIVTLDRVATAGGYNLSVTREAAERPADRLKRQGFYTTNTAPIPKGVPIALREIKGPPEDPAELILELADTGERVSVSKDKPFTRVDSHEVELKYPPENKNFPALRTNMTVRVAGEDYKLVAINPPEVVLLASSNERKYTVRQAAAR